ncbi:ADP-ribosylglycohydrolase family protein [Chitinophaga rhizophila]|uniref:ADP-ribosylglycohydrolase family protein n=1 Tax=Chitinophaga rhizophila TaxID=2866212 RepID=A0ABS7GLG9_9BACT|nr:ADP-ribosylglycohydrolase family protein [Chitinophaga rhizophila]MBW8687512.1 ADP-ribosylglycohydrolase family protein [Chitinophaga rhizophila]
MNSTPQLHLAKTSLTGLSVGDAFGETFFGKEDIILERLARRKLQEGIWPFTDDTVMSIGIYKILATYGEINQDALAKEFAANYLLDDYRGYGGTAHSILKDIAAGHRWKDVSKQVFDGMGSMGNGAAMRAGLIGAFFHENETKLIEQAILSAEITHFNQEAIAGAIAIALAAGICVRFNKMGKILTPAAFFEHITAYTPDSDVKHKIRKAATLPPHYDIRTVTFILGNGSRLTAQDTVPFALWCIAYHLYDYETAIWTAVSGLGDRDTIAAITGSVVVLSAGIPAIPDQWLQQRENIELSPFLR